MKHPGDLPAAGPFGILRRIHDAAGSMLAGPPGEHGRGSWAEQVAELDVAVADWVEWWRPDVKVWRWPVQVYVEAETAVQAVELLSAALDDALGHDNWTSDQVPVSDGPGQRPES